MEYFDYDYDGPTFELFGPGHLVALGLIAAAVSFLVWGWRNPGESTKRRVRLSLAGIILVVESSWYIWAAVGGNWTAQQGLPLHLCSVGIWCSMYMLAMRDYRVYEILFFFGVAGATQGVLTPSAGDYGLPHFWAIQTLASHGLLIIALVYMTSIEGFRPTWRSVWKTVVFINIYLVLVSGVNKLIGSNYMYTMSKPATSSLLDLMGPWPWYLVTGQIVAITFFSLLYLPFFLSDRRSQPG
ncbi:MAG: TIGR02206 family membrane protein [Gammaproteobacteria bacterium]|nr:TIGR02206 family membrane protein [Gammaproteobacteria bacterium]